MMAAPAREDPPLAPADAAAEGPLRCTKQGVAAIRRRAEEVLAALRAPHLDNSRGLPDTFSMMRAVAESIDCLEGAASALAPAYSTQLDMLTWGPGGADLVLRRRADPGADAALASPEGLGAVIALAAVLELHEKQCMRLYLRARARHRAAAAAPPAEETTPLSPQCREPPDPPAMPENSPCVRSPQQGSLKSCDTPEASRRVAVRCRSTTPRPAALKKPWAAEEDRLQQAGNLIERLGAVLCVMLSAKSSVPAAEDPQRPPPEVQYRLLPHHKQMFSRLLDGKVTFRVLCLVARTRCHHPDLARDAGLRSVLGWDVWLGEVFTPALTMDALHLLGRLLALTADDREMYKGVRWAATQGMGEFCDTIFADAGDIHEQLLKAVNIGDWESAVGAGRELSARLRSAQRYAESGGRELRRVAADAAANGVHRTAAIAISNGMLWKEPTTAGDPIGTAGLELAMELLTVQRAPAAAGRSAASQPGAVRSVRSAAAAAAAAGEGEAAPDEAPSSSGSDTLIAALLTAFERKGTAAGDAAHVADVLAAALLFGQPSSVAEQAVEKVIAMLAADCREPAVLACVRQLLSARVTASGGPADTDMAPPLSTRLCVARRCLAGGWPAAADAAASAFAAFCRSARRQQLPPAELALASELVPLLTAAVGAEARHASTARKAPAAKRPRPSGGFGSPQGSPRRSPPRNSCTEELWVIPALRRAGALTDALLYLGADPAKGSLVHAQVQALMLLLLDQREVDGRLTEEDAAGHPAAEAALRHLKEVRAANAKSRGLVRELKNQGLKIPARSWWHPAVLSHCRGVANVLVCIAAAAAASAKPRRRKGAARPSGGQR